LKADFFRQAGEVDVKVEKDRWNLYDHRSYAFYYQNPDFMPVPTDPETKPVLNWFQDSG